MIKRVFLLFLTCLALSSPLCAAESYLLGEIVIDGLQRVKEQTVLDVLQIRPGQAVRAGEIDDAIQDIYGIGRFSDVTASISEESGARVLTFTVEERPLVRRIRFEGNDKIKTDKLLEAVTFKTPTLYDPLEIERSVDSIKAMYIVEGYYAAEVTADSHVGAENIALVTFRIDEGKLVRIKKIAFVGNTVFDRDDLLDMMDTREKWFLSWLTGRGTYNEVQLAQDVERIANGYYDEGYIRVNVREPVLSLVDDVVTCWF